MEFVIMEFIVLAVFGGIVAAIAHSRGRSPIGWFFIGFFAELFAQSQSNQYYY